jgi:hypothetical protein
MPKRCHQCYLRAMDMTCWLPQTEATLGRCRDSKGAYGHAGKVLVLRQWETGEPLYSGIA